MSAARTQYERMVDDAQRDQLPFPDDFESRRFEPSSNLVTVGRISPGKPADVDIALTGDTADPGISHHQCLFEADGEGWMLHDGSRTVGSTNGTFVNDRTESLGPAETFRLSDGDRIYIGAWTCLTVSLPPA
jgi:pSer/pThr/pTyr-binding forkhead associated (FHA) protein